jgi:hypothetical protein
MWIFSQEGFYSIVQKEDSFHVRARRQRDLVNVGLSPVKSYPGSDYPWRAILNNKIELLKLVERLGDSVKYPNFKNRIGERADQKSRLGTYHKIWALMAKEQES